MRPKSLTHEDVNKIMLRCRQGDVIAGPLPFIHASAPATPLTEEHGDDDVIYLQDEVEGWVLLTQTCDLVRSCTRQPYVEVAPLVIAEEKDLRAIQRGRFPRYAMVPGLDDVPRMSGQPLVVDLGRVMTVDKSVVALRQNYLYRGCRTDKEVRRFALALTRKRARFAFPDKFHSFVSELQAQLENKHNKNSPEGRALRHLEQIRVYASPSWNDDNIELTFFFIRKSDELAFEDFGWAELRAKWLALLHPSPPFSTVQGWVLSLEDLTAQQYVDSDPLDLDRLSQPKN